MIFKKTHCNIAQGVNINYDTEEKTCRKVTAWGLKPTTTESTDAFATHDATQQVSVDMIQLRHLCLRHISELYYNY